jgi:hypothetical protein
MEYREPDGKIRELRGTLSGAQDPDSVSITVGDDEIRIPRQRIVFMKQDVTLGGRKRKDA